MGNKTLDVVVVGAGPGGSIAAKKCSKAGLRALLIEKKKLPRDKVCSGMLMGRWANDLVREEFGDPPPGVLTGAYKGVALHAGRNNSVWISSHIPVGWRKNLDYWMCQKASESGTRILDATHINSMVEHEAGYQLEFKRQEDENTEKVYARFIIGADGAFSQVRRSFWPDLNVDSRAALRECYREPLSIDKDFFHWFFPHVSPSPRFAVNYKDGHFLVEGGGIKQLRKEIADVLNDYGMPSDAKPVWRDACGMSALHDVLLDDSFVPAKGNVLLAGDAAGVLLPFTQEGIGSALKSGAMAAESVVEALVGGGKADRCYLKKMQEIKTVLRDLRSLHKRMGEIAGKGAEALAEAMGSFVEKTLKL
ncbi:FAD binding domain protein [Syntrophobacter sp. SbD1]|nr:FAD binding domain protein [Syntrophobacter sp. SbD1]